MVVCPTRSRPCATELVTIWSSRSASRNSSSRRAGVAPSDGYAKDTEALIGHSPAWEQALDRARQAAATDADILIEAESGTGKELVARLIHRLSPRKPGPLSPSTAPPFPKLCWKANCSDTRAARSPAPSWPGPGSSRSANGGTLLLDEVGEMPLALQPKLLRALQEREFDRLGSNQTVHVDIRVIATTNRPLEAAVADGRFRADLFYRLNVIPLSLPPLRDRAGRHPRTGRILCRALCRIRDPGNRHSLVPGTPGPSRRAGVAGQRSRAVELRAPSVALSRGGEIGLEALNMEKLSREQSERAAFTSPRLAPRSGSPASRSEKWSVSFSP